MTAIPQSAIRNPHFAARRHFFQQCRVGVGAMALGSLLARTSGTAGGPIAAADPLAARPPHFAPRAKSVIFLFMAGGPSQLELFDAQAEAAGAGRAGDSGVVRRQQAVRVHQGGRQAAGHASASSPSTAQSGQTISECLPHLAGVADDICTLRAVKTDVFNHGPAKFFMNTGSPLFGRPSMGAWVTYGIGSLSRAICRASSCCNPARAARAAARRTGAAAFCRRPIRACRCAARARRS